mgnify:CR=1 FL=1
MDNLAIWNRNSSIDAKYTKRATMNGQQITSFSLQSVVLMATKEFGPIGKGWGYDVELERFDEGAIIQKAATFENGDVLPEVKEITHTLTIKMWYMDADTKITMPVQAGHTPYLMGTKYGPKHDNEYYKKSLADAIKKSLSMLGFGADIFLGLMDDQNYIAMLESERMLKEQAELSGKIEEFTARVKQMIGSYASNNLMHSLNAKHNSDKQEVQHSCRKLGLNPTGYLQKITESYELQLTKLKEGK